MGREETDYFKDHIQAIVSQRLQMKVSKQDSWGLFKDIIHGTVEFTYNLPEMRVPLSRVGIFEVLKSTPSGRKKDENWEYVPKFRFYPSETIDNLLEQVLDFEEHGVDVEHYGVFSSESTKKPKVRGQPESVVIPDDSWEDRENEVVIDEEVADVIDFEEHEVPEEDESSDIDYSTLMSEFDDTDFY